MIIGNNIAIELALMAIDTKKAIKNSPKHLLGIQDLKVSEIFKSWIPKRCFCEILIAFFVSMAIKANSIAILFHIIKCYLVK